MDTHHQHAAVYAAAPKLSEPLLSAARPKTDRNDFISSLVHTLVQSDTVKQASLIDSLRHQQQIIGTNSKNIHQFSRQKRKRLSRQGNKALSKTIQQARRDARQLRTDKPQLTYNDYTFMNTLWRQYVAELMKDATNEESILQRLLTADYHGCVIRVAEAKNRSLLDKEGIVIQETKNVLVIVDKSKSRRCSILKKDCLFSIAVPVRGKEQTVFVSGTAIAVRPEQRGQKRSISIEFMRAFC